MDKWGNMNNWKMEKNMDKWEKMNEYGQILT